MQYTSFAIAVIESIWPNPQGTDYLGGDYNASQVILGKQSESVIQNVQDQTAEDFTETGGWYKFIPMNIVSMKTSSSTTDSNSWNVTFTADDMIVIGKDAMEGIGVISDVLDALQDANNGGSLKFEDILKSSLVSSSPLAPRRISLKDNFFNIQDLVTPNDTVCIWFYCDPADFMPIEAASRVLGKTRDPSHDLVEVIGSGNRVPQFVVGDDPSVAQSTIGVERVMYAKALATAEGKKTPVFSHEETTSMGLFVGGEGLFYATEGGSVTSEAFMTAGKKTDDGTILANVKVLDNANVDQLLYYLHKNYPNDFKDMFNTQTSLASGTNTIKYTRGLSSQEVSIVKYLTNTWRFQQQLSGTDEQIRANEGSINSTIKSQNAKYNPPSATGPEGKRLAELNRPTAVEVNQPFSANEYIAGREVFRHMLAQRAIDVSKSLTPKEGSIVANAQAGNIKRKMLSSSSFGENAYMIMKGHVKGISTSMSANSRTISLSGGGLEHPIEKHILFFDNLLDMFGASAYWQDYTSHLVNLDPPNQIRWILSRYAPKQLFWGPENETTAAQKMLSHLEVNKLTNFKYAGSKANSLVLTRGTLAFDKPREGQVSPGQSTGQAQQTQNKDPYSIITEYGRMGTPLTFYNTFRLGEITAAFENADPTGELGNTTNPVQPQEKTTVLNMVKQIAGASTIMEFFVDNLGYLIFRQAGEAWDRTPRPEFTPTIMDYNLISFNYNENDENIVTLQDVVMNTVMLNGSTSASVGKYSVGRGISRKGGIPFSQAPDYTLMEPLKAILTPDFFRYGLRYNQIQDIFGGGGDAAKDKAGTIHRFYSKPIPRASVQLIADSSYRVGDTVYVHLGKSRKRMKNKMPIKDLISWVEKMTGVYEDMYIGNEGRFEDTSVYTNPSFKSKTALGIKNYTKSEIRHHFLATLKKMEAWGIKGSFSWDNFPTTLWYYLANPGSKESKVMIELYRRLLQTSVNQKEFDNDFGGIDLNPYISKVKFNNFVSMCFYIENVSHTYDFPTKATTDLELSYGSETICLVHPLGEFPIGFIPIGRRVKDKFGDTSGAGVATNLEYYEIKDGPWRKLMVEQFKQDKIHKDTSFVYRSSRYRNTANYLHQIAHQNGEIYTENYYG
jgi:hypothetical protein